MKKIIVLMIFFFLGTGSVFAKGLTSIMIDGKTLDEFSNDKLEYNISVPSDKESIMIGYKEESGYTVEQGPNGETSLNYGTNKFEIRVKDGDIYKINITREDNRSSDNSLKSLTVGSNQVVLGSENEYNVSVDSTLKSVEVKAVKNNEKATFVDGYGERTGKNAVTLSGEKTSIEIKVKAENEDVRTYKINITKKDYKSSDNSLKSLTIDNIKFNFKSNVFEYNLTVSYDISKIKITPTLNDAKAKLDYQEEVILKTGANLVEINVEAEDGSKVVYKLNITREEEIPIISNITIKDQDFTFDPKKYDYQIKTEEETIDFNITLSSESATYDIKDNLDLENGSIITIEAKDGEKSVNYKFKIIKDEKEKDDSEKVIEEPITTTNNESNSSTNSNFFKENEMIIALVIFGVGILSMLIAIILKQRSKVM